MHFWSTLFFSGTLTQNISNSDVSSQTKIWSKLVNIAKDLKLFYVNQLGPNRHTRDDLVHGTSDILDMAFITLDLSSRDISFSVADDHMDSDHSQFKFHLTSHSNGTHHLLNHVTDLTKQMMTCYTTH